MARVQNTQRIVQTMQRMPPAMEAALRSELDTLAQLVARRMRALAAKWRSLLTNSVHVESPAPLVRDIRPGTDYAEAVEKGVRPGGKGLPRFGTPASAGIVAWLSSKAFAGTKTPRRNSQAAASRLLELRDRYEGLAWHIRHKGVKAQPFVEPTFRQMEPVVRVRLQAAAEAALRNAPGASA